MDYPSHEISEIQVRPKKAGELWKVQTDMKWSDRKIKH